MTDEPLDEKALDALDGFLARLQAGEKPDRVAILREHPQWASALDCLEALEQLAPAAKNEPAIGDGGADAAALAGAMPCDFGPYELVREIGRGGMGVVYEARQKGLDRSVALKMILAGHLASPELVRRFQSEARAAARLRHSNIVHIHEVGQSNGQHFFTMEYIAGPSLAERIKQGPTDANAAARLVSTVARAVEHLHQQGIVHRDLKPSNILLDADGQPFVTDFGLAKVFADGGDATATGVIAGTPSYMAPEQASGRRAEVTAAADVYSLGAILYELLTGRPPFHEESTFDTLMAVLSGDPPLPRSVNPHIPRGLELICMKCLAKEPRDRYESAAALADDLDRFGRGEALAVRPPTLPQRCWSWARRQPALASRLGALGVFYIVETVNYLAVHHNADFHRAVSVVIALWVVAAIACQHMIEFRGWSLPARYAWATLDSLALLNVLLVGNGAASPLVIGYPLVIVASGLWFRVRFVWFVTLLSLLSYGVLLIDFYWLRPELRIRPYDAGDRHVIFSVGLILLGLIVAYLVERVRILSSFYGKPQ